MVIWFCLLMTLITKGTSDLLQYNCVNKTSYTPNSTYKTNLHSLLSNLYSNATIDNGFYHTTVDTVHGMFLCRGDVSTDVCGDCVGYAGKRILDLCPNETTAIIWYDNCMLRYSEKSMLGILDESASLAWRNDDNDTQPIAYMKLVGNLLDQIISRASNGSGKKFVVLEANFSPFERVYALGQCTPDLSNVDCQICFRNVIAMLPRCCYGAVGARAVFPSCNVSGYMSSKYALHGLLSMKSDVFNFGVLLLEIITGKKNSSLSTQSTKAQDLLSYAWKHWREGRALDMVDQSLGGLYSRNEVIQCIHVGLLCVQEEADDRPTMASVVLMLNSHSATRRTPNPPLKWCPSV
nr:cysteine-rich receptor-like protein kinase 25 [Ipomoea batatas]